MLFSFALISLQLLLAYSEAVRRQRAQIRDQALEDRVPKLLSFFDVLVVVWGPHHNLELAVALLDIAAFHAYVQLIGAKTSVLIHGAVIQKMKAVLQHFEQASSQAWPLAEQQVENQDPPYTPG